MAPQDYMGGRRFYAHRFEPPLAGQPKEIVRKYSGGKATAAGMRDPSIVVTVNDKDSVAYLISEHYQRKKYPEGIFLEEVISLQFKNGEKDAYVERFDKWIVSPEKEILTLAREDYDVLVSMVEDDEHALLFECLRDCARISTLFEYPHMPRKGSIDYVLAVIKESA